MSEKRPFLAVTMGDPAGVGPEIVLKALSRPSPYEVARPIVIGDLDVLERVAPLVGFQGRLQPLFGPKGFQEGVINVLSLGLMHNDYLFGKVQAECGRAALGYIKKAIALAMAGDVGGIVTAPINKEALQLAGCPHPGHTELLAELTGAKEFGMMLAGKDLRAIHLSTHVSLKEAVELVKKERVLAMIRLANRAMMGFGIHAPKIAVAGLNPHAGEAGMFGLEEREEILPAILKAKEEGILAEGPFPPDTVLLHVKEGLFDIALCLYHDQGHIALKLYDFKGFVNVTVGLPIVRTSVDHGTAFDKAGKGVADDANLLLAVELAAKMASVRLQDPSSKQ
jgi:4-hydroxythreonine-4-phosphate dehydrogenase